MSMLIPKQFEHQMAFTGEAVKAFGATKRVFEHFGCDFKQSDVLDFSAFVETLQALCRGQRRDSSGIEDLRIAISVFDAHREAVRQHVKFSDDEFRRGFASAERLRIWLSQTFPDVRSHPDRN